MGLSDWTPRGLEDYESWREKFANGGRWENFALETLNPITPDVRQQATASLRPNGTGSPVKPIAVLSAG
jgi:uncharacterized protein YcbK (DUF882 family)